MELPSSGPRGQLHLDRGIDFSAISFGKLLHVVVAESRCWSRTHCGVLEQSDRAGACAKSA
jgi:hypothetical protein